MYSRNVLKCPGGGERGVGVRNKTLLQVAITEESSKLSVRSEANIELSAKTEANIELSVKS